MSTEAFTKAVESALEEYDKGPVHPEDTPLNHDSNLRKRALASIQAAALKLVGEDESIWSQTALPGAPGGVVDETKRARNGLRAELRAKIRGEG